MLSLSLVGCSGDDKKNPTVPPESPLAKYTGAWIEPGSGLAINIKADEVLAYRYTRATCSLIENFDSLSEADNQLTAVQAGATDNNFSFLPSGEVELDRIYLDAQNLPAACENAPDPEGFDAEFVFQHIWHNFNDYYPFFTVRNVDWQQQWDTFRPQINSSTTQSQLFALVAEMLRPLDDGHVFLVAITDEIEAGFSPQSIKGWQANAIAAAKVFGVDEDDAFAGFPKLITDNLENYYSSSDFSSSDDGQAPLSWGILDGNIGYLQINSMDIEADPEIETQQQLTIIRVQMEQVLNDLVDTSSMIIDIRFNEGGSDAFSLAIAGYFTEERVLAYSRENYNNNISTPRQLVYIEPNDGTSYTKPITLITGPNTESAAEIFTLAMKELPNVTQIGESTAGNLSDILEVDIMDGWKLGLSYQVYYAADEQVYEYVGILPQTEVPVTSFTGEFFFGALPAVHQALTDFGVDLTINQSEFNEQLLDIMEATGLVGFSAAWIDDQTILETTVAGFADIDEERPITINTPFNLGSVSKTFIGTSAMQMFERELITPDTSLSDLSMPFMVDSPYGNGGEITITQLATHTSGIQDGDATYGCSYYIEADQSSLFALFDDDFEVCPQPLETNQSAFLASLLSQSGELYREDHFLDVELGEEYNYSNVGAALASEMLATASGTDFEQWTEDNIFTPLGMENTHWFNSRYSDQDTTPARRYLLLGGEPTVIPEFSLATWSDGGLKSTATDLARYLLGIVRGGELNGQRILNADSVDAMLSTVIDEPVIEGHQGVFWTNDGFMFGHNGGDPGTNSDMRYDQYHEVGFTLMYNFDDSLDELEDDEDAEDEFSSQMDLLSHLVYRRGLSLKEEASQ
jgi:CubicO group peptidase (beta-lactamase class C family)